MSSTVAAAPIGIDRMAGHRLWMLAVVLLALLLGLWSVRPTLRVELAPDQIRPFADLPYTAPAPAPAFPYSVPGDDTSAPRRSSLVVYENGTKLGPAHVHHDRIRDVGRGAYSHWGRTVLFSSSDQTDPRSNGRRYTLEARAELSPILLWPGLLLTAATAALALRHWWVHRPAVRRAAFEPYQHPGTDRDWIPAHRLGLSRLVIGLAAAAAIGGIAFFGGAERSAWILMTAPDSTHMGNSLLGWSVIYQDRPIHLENTPFFSHLLMFSGGPIASDFYALRPVYAYMASILVPLLGWVSALLVTNLIGWAAGIALVHAFTLEVTGRRTAAFWASLLSVGGMGFVAHVHDYSAHLLAFTFYFGAVYLVYASEIWRASRSWRVHAALGCYLAVASLEYHTGLAALLGYALVSARHNRLLQIAVVSASVYGCVLLWPHLLNWLGGTGIDYGAFERGYLKGAVETWVQLSADPLLLARSYGGVVLRFLSYEMPLLVAFGIAGISVLAAVRRSLDFTIFLAAFFPVPILALSVYMGPGLVSRGYISYQTSIFVYAGAGWLLHRLAALGPRGPLVAGLTGLGLLGAGLAWNLAYLHGLLGPLKIYFLGIEYYWTGLTGMLSELVQHPEVISLTGAEAAPRLFFGSATLLDAGLVPCGAAGGAIAPESASLRALAVRAPVALLTAGMAVLLLRTGLLRLPDRLHHRTARASWAAGALVILAGPAALMNYPVRASQYPSFCRHEFAVAGRHLRYEVDISSQFLAKLDALPAEVEVIEIMHGLHAVSDWDASARVALVGDGLRIDFSSTDHLPRVSRADVLAALHRTPRLAIEATHISAAPFASASGWQRNGLAGRRLIVDGRVLGFAEQPVLPTFEIRARLPGSVFLPTLAGF